jgi:hypothetical protein
MRTLKTAAALLLVSSVIAIAQQMPMPMNADRNSEIQKDLLWGLYQDVRGHARHAETLRANAVNYMVLVAGALIAAITIDKEIDRYDLPLSIVVSLIGLMTVLFSASYAELYSRNRKRAEQILKCLDESFFYNKAQPKLSTLIDGSRDEKYPFKWVRSVTGSTGSTHWYWIGLPVIVSVVGILLIYRCVAQ